MFGQTKPFTLTSTPAPASTGSQFGFGATAGSGLTTSFSFGGAGSTAAQSAAPATSTLPSSTSLLGGLSTKTEPQVAKSASLGAGLLGSSTAATTTTTAAPTSTTTDTKPLSFLSTSSTNPQTTVTSGTNLPTVLSYTVPSLTPTKTDAPKPAGLGGISLLGSTASPATTALKPNPNEPASSSVSGGVGSIMRSQSIKDQNLPQQLAECVENFKLV